MSKNSAVEKLRQITHKKEISHNNNYIKTGKNIYKYTINIFF